MSPGETTALKARSSSVSNPWELTDALVFLGFRVLWRKRVGDFDRNLQFARSWEQDFESWAVHNREIELLAPTKGYFVKLSDGIAHFTTESAEGYSEAIKHVTEILGTLASEQDSPGLVAIDAQFLQPIEQPFESLVKHLGKMLFNPLVRDRVAAKTVDLAYLVDMEVDGIWNQVNIGPVRAREVPRRVAARTLRKLPPVAIFLSVTSRKPFSHELSELSSLVSNTGELGREILEAIQI